MQNSFILSVTNKLFMLSVIMLSVIMLNVIMLIVILLSVVVPITIIDIGITLIKKIYYKTDSNEYTVSDT
jgi:hypothetical protein